MNAHTIDVSLGDRSYPIRITHGEEDAIGRFARERNEGALAFIVADENVGIYADRIGRSLEAQSFEIHRISVPSGEQEKSLQRAASLYDRLADASADRRTLLIPAGGGVVGDLTGFVAATYARGIPFLMVPTTLLAMVDSSVGGKTAVNHPKAKNLIGAFHQPVGVWIDTAYLVTLPDREYRSGLAEVIKYGLIMDEQFFEFLEKNIQPILQRDPEIVGIIVARCCRLKADVVEADERETSGRRAILNYGHTFAHAFETAAGYGNWLHGEAVAAGMACAARASQKLGLIGPEIVERQNRLLEVAGLPIKPEPWPAEELLSTMRNDKKTLAGKLRLILIKQLGEAALVENVSADLVAEVLAIDCETV